MKKARRVVRVDHEALAKVRASSVLALDPSTLFGLAALPAEETQPEAPSGAVGVVRIDGPIAQRAVLDLCGYVDGYDAIAARFELAASDPEVSSVLLVIDSPGGDVAGLVEGVRAMLDAKKASGKRVVCYVDELAASAAYWIAATVADEIVVPETGAVGSIGTLAAYADTSQAQEQDGVKWTVIRDPAGKADTMPMAPLHDLAVERLTELVRESTARFVSTVAAARQMDPKAVRELNGAVLRGSRAVKAGLADRVGTLKSALESAGPNGQKAKRKMTHAKALGLGTDATEQDVDAAIAAVGNVMAALGVDSIAGLEGKVAGLIQRADALGAQVVALEGKLAAYAAEKLEADIERVVEKAIADRKVPPARRDEFMAKAKARGLDFVEALLEELPVLVGKEPPPAPAKTSDAEELSETELAHCEELKVDPKVYLANKRKMLAAQAKGAA